MPGKLPVTSRENHGKIRGNFSWNRRKAPANVALDDLQGVLDEVVESANAITLQIAEFTGENIGKTNEDLDGKIGRVWLKLDNLRQTAAKSVELVERAIRSTSVTPDENSSINTELRALRKLINDANRSITRMEKIGVDTTMERSKIEMLENRIADLMEEHGIDKEPPPIGRKSKRQLEEEAEKELYG